MATDPSKSECTSKDNTHDVEVNSTLKAAETSTLDVAPQGQLHRKLKSRHMQMIAIGGSIGAGLFISSGSALFRGGPGGLFIAFLIVGVMMLFTMNALGELAVVFPVNGAFYDYSVRFIDPAWGFAMGWNYAIQLLVVLPFELTAAGITISYWDPEQKINLGVWITVFLIGVVIINIFGVRGYGEIEFALGLLKVTAIIGFIITAIIINVGGVSTDDRGYIGFEYWQSPYQVFRNGFPGFCSVFVSASAAFGATELVGLAAAEAANPTKTIPRATKQVFWRITLFYILSLFLLGLIVPSNDPTLAKAHGANSAYSPFIKAFQLAGIKVLPSIFNAVIMMSVVSVATSVTYGSTRLLQALAMKQMAPKVLAKVDGHGRPWVALIVALAFGLLAYVNLAPDGGNLFNWLLAIVGLSSFFTWASINLAHIRFRKAWAHNNHSTDELPFRAIAGVTGSYIGLAINVLCIVATFYTSLYPVGGPNLDATVFFSNFLCAPVVLLFVVGYKLVKRDWSLFVDIENIDIDIGRRDLGLTMAEADVFTETEEAAKRPLWKKLLKTIF